MPITLEIDGIGDVEVGDSFKNMSPDAQHAFVDQIRSQAKNGIKSTLPETKPTNAAQLPSVGEDIAKSIAPRTARGLIGLATSPVDMPKMAEYGASWLMAKAAEKAGLMPQGKTADDFIADSKKTFGAPEFAAPQVQKSIEKYTGEFYEPKTSAGKIATAPFEMIPAALAGPNGMLKNIVAGTTGGMASEGARQAFEGTKYEMPAQFAGLLAGAYAPSAMSKAITPFAVSQSRAPLIKTLEENNIPMTAGQKTGSKPLQYMESVLGDIPGSGGKASAIQDAQKTAYTSAALKKAGINDPLATPEAMSAGYERLGNTFDNLAAKNTLQMDGQFANDLKNVTKQYTSDVPVNQRVPGFENYIDDIVNFAKSGGKIEGSTYSAMRSQLTKKAESFAMKDPQTAEAYRGLRNALDSAMERSISPADKVAWQEARRQYGNYKVLERAASGAGEGAAEGFISPNQLRGAVATGNNRGRYARGQGDLADLARAGVGVLSPLPQSGTAPRLLAQSVMAAPGAAIGAMLGGSPGAALGTMIAPFAPAIAGRGLMSGPVQAYLGNQIIPNGGLLSKALSKPNKRVISLMGRSRIDPRERAAE